MSFSKIALLQGAVRTALTNSSIVKPQTATAAAAATLRSVIGLHTPLTRRPFHAAALPAAHPAQVSRRRVKDQEPEPFVIACSREKPHPAKGNRGEDACFTLDGQTYFVAGIADGVGGWSQQGVDSGEYSRELMENARKCAIDQELRQDPKLLMDKAHVDMSDKKLGSCTACIVVIEDNKLRYANLGDSGLLGYRPRTRETFARSEEQQHSFNCPFQLGHDSGDSADDARGEIVDVHEHDIIVLGTDGFFDNLHDKDIIRLLGTFMTKNLRQSNWPRGNHTAEAKATTAVASSSTMTPQEQARTLHTATELAASLSTATASTDLSSSSSSSLSDYLLSAESLQKLADHLVEEAHKVAKDPNALRTPFNEHALKKGKRFRGGKMDDITVVVAQVQRLLDLPPNTAHEQAV